MRLTLEDRFRGRTDQLIHDPWDVGPILLAVSGGSDSTALMHLAAGVFPPEALHVVTVDHGLRPVADEIALVADQAAALGLKHSVLQWSWDGQGNLQAAARDGRWAAIEAWAAQFRADVCCLTGHTKEDQAETVLMRLARGSGVAGLSAMQSVGSTAGGLRVVRPLLAETRAELRDWLEASHIAWSDDPSNLDPRFDRVKARALRMTLEGLGLTVDRLVRTAEHMQSAKREMTAYAAMIAKERVTQVAGDLVFARGWADHPDVAPRLFRHALHYIGGGAYPPRSDACTALWQAAQSGQGGTLGGCLVTVEGDTLRLAREAAACGGPAAWHNRTVGQMWDGRWLVSEEADANIQGDLTIRALGDHIKDVSDWRDTGLPRTSLVASPAVFDGETLISAPAAGLQNGFCARIVADFQTFLLSR